MAVHQCDKAGIIESLQRDQERIYKDLHGNGQPGIIKEIAELSGLLKPLHGMVVELQGNTKEIADYVAGEIALKNNKWKRLQVWGLYLGIIISIAVGFFESKKEVPTEQLKAVLRQELKNYNITDDEIILRGRSVKPEGMTPEKQKKEIKSMNK